MAWRIVRQPDGKLAVFSDVVENVTVFDMTQAEAVDYCVSKGMTPRGAREKVLAGVEDRETWSKDAKGTGLSRWGDALSLIAKRHGRDALTEMLTETGFPDYDVGGLDLTPYAEEADAAPTGPS